MNHCEAHLMVTSKAVAAPVSQFWGVVKGGGEKKNRVLKCKKCTRSAQKFVIFILKWSNFGRANPNTFEIILGANWGGDNPPGGTCIHKVDIIRVKKFT